MIGELEPIRLVLNRFGGSHAQRDALQRTLLESALRAGELELARTLVAERISLRESSVYGWSRRARLLRAMDDVAAAADAADATARDHQSRFAAALRRSGTSDGTWRSRPPARAGCAEVGRERFGPAVTRMTEPRTAAASDAARIPILASSWMPASEKASPVTKMDTVKPMPASAATPTIPLHVASAGSTPMRRRVAIQVKAVIADELPHHQTQDHTERDRRRGGS